MSKALVVALCVALAGCGHDCREYHRQFDAIEQCSKMAQCRVTESDIYAMNRWKQGCGETP